MKKKINAVFCIKVHFSIINLCKQSPMGNKKRKLYYFAQEKKGKEKKKSRLSSKAGSTILSMPKFEWQKSELSKDLSSCFRFYDDAKILTQHFESHTGLHRPR